jgi:hypothetical protein
MSSKFSALFFGLALAAASGAYFTCVPVWAAAAATPESDLAYQMAIDAGRVDAMVTRAEEAADLILADKMPKEPANLREYDETTVRNLKIAILRYNLLAEAACEADRPNREFCGEPYMPDWLRAPASTPYSQSQMQTMIREANARITPMWNAVCARARTASRNERYCELE